MWSDIEQTWFLQGIGCSGECTCISDTVYNPGYPGSFDGEVIVVDCVGCCCRCTWVWTGSDWNEVSTASDGCNNSNLPCSCTEDTKPTRPGNFLGENVMTECT